MPETYKEGKWVRFMLDETPESDFPAGLNLAGTYAIFVKDECIYIGQSENIKKRLKTHIQMSRYSNTWKTSWGDFLKVEVAVRKERFSFERIMIEARLIYRIKPLFNQLLKSQEIRKNKRKYKFMLKAFRLTEQHSRRMKN